MTMEREWIHQVQRRWSKADLRHDTFFDPRTRQILTTDMLVDGVHFSLDYFQPRDLGWRAIAVNLSDIAATGGIPSWVLISLGVPPDCSLDTLEQLYDGIQDCCNTYRCSIVGGDTVKASQLILSVTAIGALPNLAHPGRRNMARPGDLLVASGYHGLSRAGMEALKNHTAGFSQARQAHLRPDPQLRLGQQVAQVLPRFAMMDSSDGLADAATQIAEASGVDILLEEKRIPLHPDLVEIAGQAGADPLEWALYGGEDFHLVASLPPETIGLFPELKPIGTVKAKSAPLGQARLKRLDGTVESLNLDKTYQHFSPPEHQYAAPEHGD